MPRSPEPLRVALTGLNCSENPGPGIGVARCLRDWLGDRVELCGLCYDATEATALAGTLLDHVFLMPYVREGWQPWVQRLEEIQQRVGVDVLVPNLDAELSLLLPARSRLNALGITCRLPSAGALQLRDKRNLKEMAKRIGLQVPRTRIWNGVTAIAPLLAELGYPLYLKGPEWGSLLIHSPEQLQEQIPLAQQRWGRELLLQASIPGSEFNLAGLGDGAGYLDAHLCLRKEQRSSLGKLWTAQTVQAQWLVDAALAFVEQTRWEGPFELECLLHPEFGALLLEINPRFPAWIHAASQLNVNLPAKWVGSLSERKAPCSEVIPAGTWILREIRERIVDADLADALTQAEGYSHAEVL